VFVSPDGKKYEGNWVKNKKNGTGRLECPDGRCYEGDFKEVWFFLGLRMIFRIRKTGLGRSKALMAPSIKEGGSRVESTGRGA
jgi:hypothetical protein